MIDRGIFDYSYYQNKKKHTVSLDLNALEPVSRPSRVHLSGRDCWDQYREWIDILLERFHVCLKVPHVINCGVQLFSVPDHVLTKEQVVEKATNFKEFFSQINSRPS